jgi:hypothetical protein
VEVLRLQSGPVTNGLTGMNVKPLWLPGMLWRLDVFCCKITNATWFDENLSRKKKKPGNSVACR